MHIQYSEPLGAMEEEAENQPDARPLLRPWATGFKSLNSQAKSNRRDKDCRYPHARTVLYICLFANILNIHANTYKSAVTEGVKMGWGHSSLWRARLLGWPLLKSQLLLQSQRATENSTVSPDQSCLCSDTARARPPSSALLSVVFQAPTTACYTGITTVFPAQGSKHLHGPPQTCSGPS